MRCAKFSALEGGSVTVVRVAYGCDMHYTYLMSATLRCSGIVPFWGYVVKRCGMSLPHIMPEQHRGPEFESGWGEFF